LAESTENDEEMVELSTIYKTLERDGKAIVHDLRYASKALRSAGIVTSILAAVFAIAAGALIALTFGPNPPGLGFGLTLLVIALALGGVSAKFLLDYKRLTKRYQRLFYLYFVENID
jgi:hypothetical protein